MPQPNPSQPKPPQTEFLVDISGEKTHVEVTFSSQQFKQALRPLALIVSHLVAAGLATTGMNPALLKLPETMPPVLPTPKTCDHNLDNFRL